MAAINKERRRSPRFPAPSHTLSVSTLGRARVIDVSLGGVLISAESPLPNSLQLRLSLRGNRFSSGLQVCHRNSEQDGSIQVGAAFVGMNADSRRALELFLNHATPRKHQVHES